MLEIDKSGNIKVNRGDTFIVPLFIDISDNIFNSTRFPLHDNDILHFHLMEANAPFHKFLLKKRFTVEDINENGDVLIRFEHLDTEWLFPGIYYYEIKLQRVEPDEIPENYTEEDWENCPSNDTFVTIVPRRKFVIQ